MDRKQTCSLWNTHDSAWRITGAFIVFAALHLLVEKTVSQNLPQKYNYASMGLSVTCDFEWSMCGWTQEGPSAADQMDWRRHRGPGGTGYYKVQGDHTPGKDAFGFYLYLDVADYRRPYVDPEIIDSIEHPEPDELLAQQMGMASSSIHRKPSSGPLHLPPKFPPNKRRQQYPSAFLVSAPGSSYPYFSQTHNSQYSSSGYNYPPDSHPPPVRNQHGRGTSSSSYQNYAAYPPPRRAPNVDTNSDVKPYDLMNYGIPADPVYPSARVGSGQSVQRPPMSPYGALDVQPQAQLVGPRIEAPINLTLKFWFHMRGNGVGRLTLFRKALARPDEIIWEKSGHQTFQWSEAQVPLEQGSFQLVFEGSVIPRMAAAGGYIGIDDIHLDREAELPMLINAAKVWPTMDPRMYALPSFRSYPGQMFDPYGSNGIIPIQTTTAETVTINLRSQNFPPLFPNSHASPSALVNPLYPIIAPPSRGTSYNAPTGNSELYEQRTSRDDQLISVPLHVQPTKNQLDDSLKPPSWQLSPEGYQLFPKYSTVKPTAPPATLQTTVTTTLVTLHETAAPVIVVRKPEILPQTYNDTIFSGEKYFEKQNNQILPQLLPIAKSVTSSIFRPFMKDTDQFLPLDHTELSAVMQEEEPLNKTKLFIIIASCFGGAALVVIIAFLIVRGTSGFYSLVPCLERHRSSMVPQLSSRQVSSVAVSRQSTYLQRRPQTAPPQPPLRPS